MGKIKTYPGKIYYSGASHQNANNMKNNAAFNNGFNGLQGDLKGANFKSDMQSLLKGKIVETKGFSSFAITEEAQG